MTNVLSTRTHHGTGGVHLSRAFDSTPGTPKRDFGSMLKSWGEALERDSYASLSQRGYRSRSSGSAHIGGKSIQVGIARIHFT
jgi:hypothetical protein